MKIVVLDKATLGADIDLSPIAALGELTAYENTPPELVAERIAEAEIVIQNKVRLNAQNLAGAKNLKLICEAATGYDNIDIKYCNDLLECLNYWLPDEDEFNCKEVLTTVHIPIMIMNIEKAKQMMDDEEITIEQYKKFLKYWVTEGFYLNEYRECSEGSPSDKRNIEKRIDFMEKSLESFIKM